MVSNLTDEEILEFSIWGIFVSFLMIFLVISITFWCCEGIEIRQHHHSEVIIFWNNVGYFISRLF